MQAIVDVSLLCDALKGMKPHSSRRKALRDPVARLVAAGSSIVFLGEFGNGASVVAEVLEVGEGELPIRPVIKLLATFPKKSKVTVRVEEGAIWLNKIRLPFTPK
ncbi:MAG: hypothetical protein AB7E72_21185 [Lysobacterales bacterium]